MWLYSEKTAPNIPEEPGQPTHYENTHFSLLSFLRKFAVGSFIYIDANLSPEVISVNVIVLL